MKKYLRYARYVIRHCKYVRRACFAKGLYWQGIVHDLSKWRQSEFIPYARFFYGPKPPMRNTTGYYKPTDTGNDAFDFAWLLHQKRNPHHWQFWILQEDEGGVKVLEIPHRYRLEMLCDWYGASMAQGYGGKSRTWYAANREKMQLHPATRAWVEANVSDDFLGLEAT